jgi:hypothetical protein
MLPSDPLMRDLASAWCRPDMRNQTNRFAIESMG